MARGTAKWERRRLLLTGGAGFIGSQFAAHCLAHSRAERLVVLDSLTYAAAPGSLDGLSGDPAFRFVKGDICDGKLVRRLLREEALDCIVNFAAETHVDRSIDNPEEFIRTNILGVRELLEAAREVWCSGSGRDHRFHQVSTDEVFGPAKPDEGLRDETRPYNPGSPYAASKAAADHLVTAWRNTYGLQASISYSSNVYGPGQHPEKLVPLAISRLLNCQPVPVYGDGLQRRGWIFVRDLCAAMDVLLGSGWEGTRFFVGGEHELSNLELLEQVIDLIGAPARRSLLHHVADRPGHDRRYGMSSGAFRARSGFQLATSLREGLVETVNWYRERHELAARS